MAEPQPSTVNEGMDNEDAPLPTNPEDRKAAAAMSSLDARGDDEPASKITHIDQEALGKAISRLEVSSGKGKAGDEGKVKAKEVEEKKKAVKVDQADVMLLVSSWGSNTMGEGVYRVALLITVACRRLRSWTFTRPRLLNC